MQKKKNYSQVTIYLPNRVYREYVAEAKKLTIPLVALIRIKLGVEG